MNVVNFRRNEAYTDVKKQLHVVLLIIMTISLIACGKEQTQNDKSDVDDYVEEKTESEARNEEPLETKVDQAE